MKTKLATLAVLALAPLNAFAVAQVDISTEAAALKDELTSNIPKAMTVGLVALAFVIVWAMLRKFSKA